MEANICRTCTEQFSGELLVPIFSKLEDQFIANVIVDCSSVTINEDDGLPTSVCTQCLNNVRVIVHFAQKVRESDRKLRKLFKGEVPAVGGGGSDLDESFLEVKVELVTGEEDDQVEHKYDAADSWSDFENDADDSDWKGEYKDTEDESSPEVEEELLTPIKRKVSRSSDAQKETVKKKLCNTATKKFETTGEDQDSDGGDVLDEVELEAFKLVEIDPSRLVCCLCCADFATEDELKQHGKKEHMKITPKGSNVVKDFECDFCCRRYSTQEALKNHKEMTAKLVFKKIYECTRCHARFHVAKRRRNHIHNPLKDGKLPKVKRFTICCMKNCNQKFNTEEDLLEHGQKDHAENKSHEKPPGKPHECPVCFKWFETMNTLIRHRRRVYHLTAMQCSICGQEFKSKSGLIIHERKHMNDKPFACEQCNKRFLSNYALTYHMLVHKDDKPFVCTVCGSDFRRESYLKNHMKAHSEELPFKCDLCGKDFKTKAYLRDHRRTHAGQKPFPCQYCDMSFACQSNRRRHERVHSGIKPFQCSYCDQTFSRRQRCMDHESTHTGIQPYRCETCNSSFSHQKKLKKHQETHQRALDNPSLALVQPSSVSTRSPMPPMSLPPMLPSFQLQRPVAHSSILNQAGLSSLYHSDKK